jgi:hypothetical protein
MGTCVVMLSTRNLINAIWFRRGRRVSVCFVDLQANSNNYLSLDLVLLVVTVFSFLPDIS